QFVLIA
ncbi:hypothetical protein D027_4501B, partial [Vibrio parahaemolyticus 861]